MHIKQLQHPSVTTHNTSYSMECKKWFKNCSTQLKSDFRVTGNIDTFVIQIMLRKYEKVPILKKFKTKENTTLNHKSHKPL